MNHDVSLLELLEALRANRVAALLSLNKELLFGVLTTASATALRLGGLAEEDGEIRNRRGSGVAHEPKIRQERSSVKLRSEKI
jgi:hypothetical protein